MEKKFDSRIRSMWPTSNSWVVIQGTAICLLNEYLLLGNHLKFNLNDIYSQVTTVRRSTTSKGKPKNNLSKKIVVIYISIHVIAQIAQFSIH